MSAASKKARKTDDNFAEDIKKQAKPQIWPEWSDAEVTAEKFGTPIGPVKGKGKGSAKSEKSSKGTLGAVEQEKYDDPYETPLPWSLKTKVDWIRPGNLTDPEVGQLVIYSTSSGILPDLVTNNRHMFKSSLIRAIVSAIHMLCYIGETRMFTVEWQSPIFASNTDSLPWQPWHHIYSLGKAGKGQVHNPQANSMGKYVVRLYYLGCWRKIVLDDKIPRDSSGKLLLPVSYIDNDNEFELWPILLTKALLKIASITWTDKQEIVDFDVVTCLTGWPVQKIFTRGMDMQDIWEVCCGYSDHYTWDNRLIIGPFEHLEPVSEKGTSKTKETKSSKKGSRSTVQNLGIPTMRGYHLTATLTDLRDFEENEIEDITPCYSHDFLIEETRNIPLIDKIPDYDRNIPKWKEFRWIDWAVEHGLWDKVEEWEIYKCLRIVSSMRKTNEENMFGIESTELEQYICNSVALIETIRNKDLVNAVPAKAKTKSVASSSKKGTPRKIFINPSIWSDFEKLAPFITCISVYLKPSAFRANYIISDIPFSAHVADKSKKSDKKDDKKKKDGGEENILKYIFWENILQRTKNDAFYLFTDSIDYKLTMITMAHLGNNLPQLISETIKKEKKECKKLVCQLNKCNPDCKCKQELKEEIASEVHEDNRNYAHVILEDYDWQSTKFGEMPISLKTCGTKSVVFDFDKGRHVKRLWLDASSPFVLIVSCDSEIRIGKVSDVLELMVGEAELLTQTCYNVCSSLGNLIKVFGFPEYVPAIKQFYKSYMPVVKLSKKQMSLIHDSFKEELIKMLAHYFPQEKHYNISRAFRIILLDPNFRIPYKLPPFPAIELGYECDDCICIDKDSIRLRDRSAVIIQSFFKMIYVKTLKKLHDLYHKKFDIALDCLKLVYQSAFSAKARNISIDLIRGMACNENLKMLMPYFPFYKNMKLVIELKTLHGDVADTPEFSWVPLFRRIFFCNNTDPIFIRAYLFCSLQDYVLRIFNNDTGEEIGKCANIPLVNKYEKNERGYVVLGYGWTGEKPEKLIEWKLYFAVDKILNKSSVDIENVQNNIMKLKGHYIPNKNNLIGKFIVKIQEACTGTFYFESSCRGAKLQIQCLNKFGEILYDVIGVSYVIIPVIKLIRLEDEPSTHESSRSDCQTSSSHLQLKSESRSSKAKLSRSKSFVKKKTPKGSTDKRSQSSSLIKKRLMISTVNENDQFTEYTIQVFVLDGSWPLNPREWIIAEKLREKGLIESELPITGNTTTTAIKKSISSTKKLRDSFASKIEDEKPLWIFTSITENDNFCIIEIDDRRNEEIKNYKKSIYENDIPRFLKAKSIRNEYLEKNYINWQKDEQKAKDFSCQHSYDKISDTSYKISTENVIVSQRMNIEETKICRQCNKPIMEDEILYLRSPESLHKMLPPFEINKYDKTNDLFRWLILPEQEEKIFNDISENVNKFEDYYNTFVNEMDEYLKKRKHRHEYMFEWFNSIRQDSFTMMQENDSRREIFVKKMKELAAAQKAALK